jgi:hypothetical protein
MQLSSITLALRQRLNGLAAYSPALSLDFTSGNQTLDPRITFSRGSNATVTNKSGLIQYAPHNLLAYSEQFDNAAWTKSTATITANAVTAPDGTVTADRLDATASSAYVAVIATVTLGTTYTGSVYLKKADTANVSVIFPTAPTWGGTNPTASVNLDTATVTFSNATGNLESVGNGWYRVSITATASGGTSGGLRIILPSTTTSVYIWGAQLNVGALQPYYTTTVKNLFGYTQEFNNAAWTKSNTFVQTNFLTYSEQFNNAAWTKTRAFVQTNLLTYSEQFDNAAWSKTEATVIANTAIAPNGTTTADKIVATAVNSSHRADFLPGTLTAGSTYSASVYAKADGYSGLGVSFSGANGASFNLATGQVNGIININTTAAEVLTANIESVGDGWFRCSYSVRINNTQSFSIRNAVNATASAVATQETYTGNGTSGVFLWGAQLVEGASAGDYQQTGATVLPVMYVAPDGSLTADKLIEDTSASTTHSITQSFSGTTGTIYTATLYAKAAERNFARITLPSTIFGVSTAWAFNLITGDITPVANTAGTTATSENVGNGWWRIRVTSIAATATASGNFQVNISETGSASYSGDGTSGIYIWGAQLVQGESAGGYQPTLAAAAVVGYTDIYDQPFAQKLVENTVNNEHYLRQIQTVAAGTTVTFSIYVKAAERSSIRLRVLDSAAPTNGFFASIDTLTGATASAVAGTGTILGVQAVTFGNGWYRFSITGIASATATTLILDTFILSGNQFSASSYAGDGTSGIYIFGAQLSDSASLDPYVYNPGASPTPAAYYGPRFDYDSSTAPKDLLILASRTNLLTYSEELNTGWSNGTAATWQYSSGVSPAGTTTALGVDGLLGTGLLSAGTTLYKVGTPVIGSTTYTFSVYVRTKTGTFSSIRLRINETGGNNTTSSDFAVTTDWTRISLTVTTAAGATAVSTLVGTGTGTADLYIWGAQLETGSTATAYIPTQANQVTRQAGLGYDSVAMAPKGLLTEEQRTNLFTYSEQFDNAAWTKTRTTITADAAVSPDGTMGGDKLVEDTSDGAHIIRFANGSYTSGTTYTISFYAKAAEQTTCRIQFRTAAFAGNAGVSFDLVNLTATSETSFATGTITAVGNGWCRVTATATATTTYSGVEGFYFYIRTTGYTGDGTSGLYIWGAQMEAGAFATSYIPTVASQVTRAADVTMMTGANFSSWYNQPEGALLAEYSIPFDSSASIFPLVVGIADGTFANTIAMYERTIDDTRRFLVRTGGVEQLDISNGSAYVYGTTTKQAVAYKVNNFAISVGGAAVTTGTSGTVPVVDRMSLGNTFATGGALSNFNGHISRIAYYNRRLSNAELRGTTA